MDFETIKSALLLTLVVLLGIILYRRLIGTMSKGKGQQAHAVLLNVIISTDRQFLKVHLDLPSNMDTRIEIVNSSEEVLQLGFDGNLDKGEHDFNLDILNISRGNYTLKVSTPNQKVSRFFEI